MTKPALDGIRVLDFTQVLSGPYCTQILGDLGAEVIKVEGPAGDVTRGMPPYAVGEDSPYFLSINRNKKSVVVDLKAPEGVALVRELARTCDVVVENFRPGVLDRLGLSAASLRAEMPRLVWCSISGFGQTGPYRDKPAFDLIVQALSGGMSLTGEIGGRPVRAGLPIADIVAGLYGAVGILAALTRRGASGEGETIDVSMLDCQAALLTYQAANHLHSGIVPGTQGREHESVVTYNMFTARDGTELIIAALTDPMWDRLCRALDRLDLPTDPRFATSRDRRAHRAELTALLEAVIRTRDAESWIPVLEAEGIPVATVNTLDRVVADPQIVARNMVTSLRAADGREAAVMGDPLLFGGARSLADPLYPPAAGEHTEAVLGDLLGLDRAAIDRLVASGIVRTRRPTP